MSIFTETDPTAGGTQTQQTETGTENQTTFLDQIVQAKGENWRDAETLAKGKLEADAYILSLEDQNKQLREDLSKQDYAAEVLNEIRGKAAESSTAKTSEATENTAGVNEHETPSALDEDTLKSLVEKTLLERELQRSTEQNVQKVTDDLKTRFGDQAGDVVKAKAQELGLSLDRMEQLATESPSAFLSLFGEQTQGGGANFLNSSINTEGANMQASNERDWNYYRKLRQDNRNLYYSPKVQQQLMQDKIRLGEKFGN